MIDHLDSLLRHLIMTRVMKLRTPNQNAGQPPYPVASTQIGFRPPDGNWRTYVSSLTVQNQPAPALNVYLVDVRSNRRLRSNERVRTFDNGMVRDTAAPERIDCHYLVSAWNAAIITPAADSSTDAEYAKLHALLYEVAAVLMKNAPFDVSSVYAPNPPPAGYPDEMKAAPLPAEILPVEGFAKIAEFWGTMGIEHRWLPVVYMVVTLPVCLDHDVYGPMVTTRITEYNRIDGSGTGDSFIEIGGTVLDATGQDHAPVDSAWVQLEEAGPTAIATATTDPLGRFTFGGLNPGSYTLRVRAAGFAERTQTIDVPSETGNYDVLLT